MRPRNFSRCFPKDRVKEGTDMESSTKVKARVVDAYMFFGSGHK
jgi:hypothetical protein